MSVLSPSMGLVIPTVGIDSGLMWEQGLSSSLYTIDNHNHTPGNGNQIPPAGLNINAELAFNNWPITNLQASVYTAQDSLATLGAIYVSGTDLYFNDLAGNTVQITSGGSVNATSSGISSGTATASFVSSILVVNAASNTPANIKAGSILLGNNVANSKYLTLAPPNAMGSDISQTLPTIPAAPSFMQMDASGNMGATIAVSGGLTASNIAAATITGSNVAAATLTGSNIAASTITSTNMAANSIVTTAITDLNVTRAKMVAVGQQVSTSCGNYTVGASFATITNLSVTITTTGRPVMIFLQSDGTDLGSSVSPFQLLNATAVLRLKYVRGSTDIAFTNINAPSGATQHTQGNFLFMDVPAAGTYTYVAQARRTTTDSITINNLSLVAYEL